MTSNRYEIDDEIYITNLLTNEDIPSFIKYLNNPKIYANTLAIPYPYTTNDGEDFIKLIKSSSLNSTGYFIIRLKANDELIGACGFHNLAKNERRADIGYWLAESYWHRGIMPKVVKKVIEIIKNEWKNLVRIEAQIFFWNKASMRVVEKCGFVFEGILRKRAYKDGKDIDVHLYALIIE
jgi:RimJ/RimL family protein N-acetyltransferase